tara:strand:+ start:246 stop:473 length:228 start_codon:yes stop_codon:yes gene_type:complete
MTNQITIRVPYSEITWGSCYAVVELKEGETAEQYLAKVKDGTADLLMDATDEDWVTDDSDSTSFDTDEAEIYHGD